MHLNAAAATEGPGGWRRRGAAGEPPRPDLVTTDRRADARAENHQPGAHATGSR